MKDNGDGGQRFIDVEFNVHGNTSVATNPIASPTELGHILRSVVLLLLICRYVEAMFICL